MRSAGMRTSPAQAIRQPRQIALLVGFILLVLVVGGVIGVATAPGDWYAGLNKPFFNPPNWLFAPVWTLLYVLIGIAGWRSFVAAPKGRAMMFWWAQLLLNWLWSPVFFSLHLLWPALIVILAILAAIISFIAASWRADRTAAWLFVPYLCWVSFATALNAAVAVLN